MKRFQKAIEISYALKPKLQTGRAFHTSFIFCRSKILAIGVNDYTKPHPENRFGRYRGYKYNAAKYQPGLHSECSAVIKAGLEDCSRLIILNLRIDNNGRLNNAHPCPNCAGVLEQLNFRRIYYSDRRGEIVRFGD